MSPTPSDLFWRGLTLANTALLGWIVLTGSVVHPTPGPGPTPQPTPVVETVKIGHDYGIKVASTWADGLDAASSAIDAGKAMPDVLTDLSTTFEANRTAAFRTMVQPTLEAIVPSSGVLDASSTPKLKAALKDLAAGARSLK